MEFIFSFLPFVVIIGIMYFMMIRPQQKQAKETQKMLDSLEKGDSVVTIGGLNGIIDEVNTEAHTVILDCEGIYLTFERRAISKVVEKGSSTVTSTEELGNNRPTDSAE